MVVVGVGVGVGVGVVVVVGVAVGVGVQMTLPESIADVTVIVAGLALIGAAVWALATLCQAIGATRRKS